MSLVFATGLVLLLTALSLLRGANARAVVRAAEVGAPARPTAQRAQASAAQLVLPDGSAVAEPGADPVLAGAAEDAAAEPAPPSAPPPAHVSAPDEAAAQAAPTGGLLAGTVVDGTTGAPCEAEIWLSIPGAPSTNLVLQAPGGAFAQRLETPGGYALVARCGGKVGVLYDVPVVAGGRTEDLVVTLREAARVRVEGAGAGDTSWTCTLVHEGAPIGLIVGATDAELTVPPGALTARLHVLGTGERRETTLSAAPGELTLIRFD